MNSKPLFRSPLDVKSLQKIGERHLDIVTCPMDTWKDDYNINYLHKMVLRYLNSRICKIKLYENEKEALKIQLSKSSGRIVRNSLEEKIKIIDKEIDGIKNSPREYTMLASDYILLYKSVDKEYKDVKVILIQKYLNMVQSYFPHRIIRDFGTIHDDKCPYDNTELVPYHENDDENEECKAICPKCNKLYDVNLESQKVVVSSKKKEYDPVANFIKIMEHVEGKVSAEFPARLWSELDEKIKEDNRLKKELTRQDVAHYLYATNNLTNFSIHLTLIAKLYCDITPPDFSNIRDEIIEDYKAFYPVYDNIEKELESSLNSLFLLWKLLARNRYSGNIDDFKPLISSTTLSKYQNYYRESADILGWLD